MSALSRIASFVSKRFFASNPPFILKRTRPIFWLTNDRFFAGNYTKGKRKLVNVLNDEGEVVKNEKKTPTISNIVKEDASEEDKTQEPTVSTTLGSTVISSVTQTDSSQKEEEESQKKEEASWQTVKLTFALFGVSFTCMGIFFVMEFGRPKTDEVGNVVEDEYSGMPVFQQYLYRIMDQVNYYKKLINEPSRDKLLPDVLKYPYHQPPYTLILELKDVLVHPDWTYNTGWRFKKRPGLDQFLETLNGVYEIVIYTAELGMTVFPIMEALDPNNLIAYKLVRDATNFVNGVHVKDLDKLNRDLSKVVVIDWDKDAIQFHRDNVLQITRWDGEDDDTTLMDLANFLRVIAISDVTDVRDVLRHYKEFDDPIAAFKEKQRELERTMYSTNSKVLG